MTDNNKRNDITKMSIEISLTLFLVIKCKMIWLQEMKKKRTYLKAMLVRCTFAQ